MGHFLDNSVHVIVHSSFNLIDPYSFDNWLNMILYSSHPHTCTQTNRQAILLNGEVSLELKINSVVISFFVF